MAPLTALVLAAALAAGSTAVLATAASAGTGAVAAKKKKKCRTKKNGKKKCKKRTNPSNPPGGTPGTAPAGPAKLTITPASKDFGDVTPGDESEAQTFVVTNIGGPTSGAVTFTTSGADAGDFKVRNDLCSGQSLASGGACTLDVVFAPPDAPPIPGPKSASVAVEAPGTSVSASLTGCALPLCPP